MSTLVQRIQDLVKRDKMEQALKELETWAAKNDDDLHNMIILQTARFNQLRRGERMGIMSREEASRTSNQIRYSVLSILEELPEVAADTGVDTTSNTANSNSTTNDTEPKARKLFISYAREDRPFVEGLQRHLSSLIRSGHIDSWSDSKILPGEEWKKKIETQLRSANIILYLVSSYFLDSDFINEHERVWSEESRTHNNALIVPVIVRPCLWEKEDFARFNAVPRHPDTSVLVPISSWADTESAYLAVAKGLSQIIENKIS